MAADESAPRVCDDCQFAGTRVSVHNDQLTDRVIEPEGSILYANYEDCGVAFGKISPQDAWSEDPTLAERINECAGPVEETVAVGRKWPLNLLGLTKEVTVMRCGALTSAELETVIDRHITHVKN